jgi:hypothetical protein
MEHLKYLDYLRAPHLDLFNLHCSALVEAKNLVISLEEEFPKFKEDMQIHNRSVFLNFISLKQLIENLEARLVMIDKHLFSKSEASVFHAIELIETPLVFTSKSDEHMIKYDMPDMPSNTWLDSLNFLISKVKRERESFKKENPIHSIIGKV